MYNGSPPATVYEFNYLIAFARGELNGRCVVAEEIGDRDKDTMHPLK